MRWDKLVVNKIGRTKLRCFWKNLGKLSTDAFPVLIYQESKAPKLKRNPKIVEAETISEDQAGKK